MGKSRSGPSCWVKRLFGMLFVNALFFVVGIPNMLSFGGGCSYEVALPLAVLAVLFNLYVIVAAREMKEVMVALLAGAATASICVIFYSCWANPRGAYSKSAEAKSNLGAIRSTEVAFFAEWGMWVGNQLPTPIAERRGRMDKVAWVEGTRFSILGFAPEGKVYCSYSLEGPDWPTEAEGFTARAECDLDADGNVSVYTITSESTDITHSGGTF